MYLEAILMLQKRMGESAVRSVDLARHMGFSKPSISHAVGVLRDGGLLTMDKDGLKDCEMTKCKTGGINFEKKKDKTKNTNKEKSDGFERKFFDGKNYC